MWCARLCFGVAVFVLFHRFICEEGIAMVGGRSQWKRCPMGDLERAEQAMVGTETGNAPGSYVRKQSQGHPDEGSRAQEGMS